MCISIWGTFNHYSRTIQMELLNCKLLLYFRNNTITFEHILSIWKVFSYTARFLPFKSTISLEGFSFFLHFSMSIRISFDYEPCQQILTPQNENFSQYKWLKCFQQYLCTTRHAFEGLFFPSPIVSTGTFLSRFPFSFHLSITIGMESLQDYPAAKHRNIRVSNYVSYVFFPL